MNTEVNTGKQPRWKTFLKLFLPFLVLSLGLAGGIWIYKTRPQAQKVTPSEKAPVVRTKQITSRDYQTKIPALGEVIPAKEITLSARVSGKVVSLSQDFLPGGHLEAGEKLLRIDPKDYELKLKQARADVVDAEYALQVEQGKQKVAQREWKLLGNSTDNTPKEPALALRKPHLRKVRAGVKRARAKLDQARINLQRTRIHAPFNAIVKSKNVDLGSRISAQDKIAELVWTDEYWIRASVPTERLTRFALPGKGKGAVARIKSINGNPAPARKGRVIEVLPNVEEKGRMARVLVRIKDPLNLDDTKETKETSPLLLGSFVQISIQGELLKDALRIPRSAWREKDRIWIVDQQGRLHIKSPRTLWKGPENIYIPDIFPHAYRLVTSDISTPVDGMKLRLAKQTQAPSPKGEK